MPDIPPPADPLAAALDDYRAFFRAEERREYQGTWLIGEARRRGEKLLAAVDAALAVAAGSDEFAVDWGGVQLDPVVYVVRCHEIREAITAALLGEDGQ